MSGLNPDCLVFIDESGFNIAMTPAYGRAPAGERIVDKKPVNRGKNYTVVGAISNQRVVCHKTLEGAMTRVRFVAFVQKTLCPRLLPGMTVILDNLRAHHAPEVRTAIEAVGCSVLYQPPYSPEFNPIELCWSFIKLWIRKLKKRSVEQLLPAIRHTFLRVRPSQLRGWFRHSGYNQCK